jgi:hypothetical protein
MIYSRSIVSMSNWACIHAVTAESMRAAVWYLHRMLSDMNANLHAGCSRRAAACVCFNESTFCPVYTRAITITFYLINKNLFTFASEQRLHVKLLEINWSKNNPASDVHSPLSTSNWRCPLRIFARCQFLTYLVCAKPTNRARCTQRAHQQQFSSRAASTVDNCLFW